MRVHTLSRTLATLAVASLAFAQDQHCRTPIMDAIPLPTQFDQPDRLILDRTLTIERLVQEGKPLEAVPVLLNLAGLYHNLGLIREEMTAYVKASMLGKGAPSGLLADAGATLASSRINLENGFTLGAWDEFQTALGLLMKLEPDSRKDFRLRVASLGFRIQLAAADTALKWKESQLPASLEIADQVLLFSILNNSAPERTGQAGWRPLSPAELHSLEEQRPWREALIQRAWSSATSGTLVLTKQPESIEQALAKAIYCSQSAEIYARLGKLERAIQLQQDAADEFERFGQYSDALESRIAVCRYIDELVPNVDFNAALNASLNVVRGVESYSRGMGGQTLEAFLRRYSHPYLRLYYLFRIRHDNSVSAGEPLASRSLVDMLMHADRMNLRAVRKDQLVYREFGSALNSQPQLASRFREQEKVVRQREAVRDQAQARGEEPADYRSIPGIGGTGPFAEFDSAKRDLISKLEDLKRSQLKENDSFKLLSSDWDSMLQGMGPDQAVVMYVQEPGADSMVAAILHPDPKELRLVTLPKHSPTALPDLIAQLRRGMALAPDGKEEVAKTLDQIADLVWRPLGKLPLNLTILLTPHLIGLPFEALPGADGNPLAAQHTIRYAFGLQRGLGKYLKIDTFRRALVVGAGPSADPNFPALPASRTEVLGVRDFLARRGVALQPADPFPAGGLTPLAGPAQLDLVHISTHSSPDRDLPLMDFLWFSSDRVFGYHLAILPLRARLAVLSTCELFTARANNFNPVSGLSTAMLANVAPQVISTLWDVNDDATSMFMRRFYQALLDTHEPAAALAAAKRDFSSADRLEQWMRSAKIAVPPREELLTHPAYWAPFVLIIGPNVED